MDRTVRGMTFTEKLLTSQPPIDADGRRFKRYYVTTDRTPLPDRTAGRV
jgi:hypothetical protein